ncbi:hypothetical protein MF1_03370 [Bartonella quintana]|nr:hypothetical protein MF1_03370 [Bartonella quintana]
MKELLIPFKQLRKPMREKSIHEMWEKAVQKKQELLEEEPGLFPELSNVDRDIQQNGLFGKLSMTLKLPHRSMAVLYKDFLVRYCINGMSGVSFSLSQFRLKLAIAPIFNLLRRA